MCVVVHVVSSLAVAKVGALSPSCPTRLQSSLSDFLDTADVGDLSNPVAPGGVEYFVRCGRCNAAYTITPAEIGPDGSRVKCEVCGHTWFQAANRLQVLAEGYTLRVSRHHG